MPIEVMPIGAMHIGSIAIALFIIGFMGIPIAFMCIGIMRSARVKRGEGVPKRVVKAVDIFGEWVLW